MATTTDSAAGRSQHCQDDADNQQDDPDDQENMRKGKSRNEARQDEPEDYANDSEEDHGEPF